VASLSGALAELVLASPKTGTLLSSTKAEEFVKIIGFVVIVLMTASAYAQEGVSDEKQILRLEDDWGRALVTRDRKLLEKIVDRDFTFIEPDGTVKNRDEYLADRSSDVAHTESFEYVDLKVRVFGNFALASGVSKITERRQGKRYRFKLRWKEMWRKDQGRWRVLTSQATPVNRKWDASFIIKE
jgi:ketosteroid isomerase-like protein